METYVASGGVRVRAAAAVGEFETAFAGTYDDEAKLFVRRILDYAVEREA